MKRSVHNIDLLVLDDCTVVGVSFGYAAVTEHECGIASLRQDFGLNPKKLGFEARRNNRIPQGLIHKTIGVSDSEPESEVIMYAPVLNHYPENFDFFFNRYLHRNKDSEDLVAAWSDCAFGVRAFGDRQRHLQNLYDAFQTKNAVVGLSIPNFIGSRGLMITDYRLIPEKARKEARQLDLEARKKSELCQRLEEESGVRDLLREHGKKYTYLGVKDVDEKGKPLWWLNGDKVFGWYTTPQLRQWVRNRGPIAQMEKNASRG